VAEGLAAKGIHLIDGPVSGGVSGAEAGTLAIMTSGDAASQKAVEPVLKAIGQNIFYLGAEPGLGQTMKLVNNVILASNTLACLEGMVLGAKAGLDTKLMFDVLNASSGRSFMSEKRVPQAITERAQGFPVRFAAGLMHKDVKLCLEEAERFGVPMFMGPAARQYLSMALAMGSGPEDFVSTIQHMEKLAGIEVRATPKESGD
jgi:3-hydroxyisobutyrate dehydrogenase